MFSGNYLDEEGIFTRGPWRGESVSDVGCDAPEYLQDILDEGDVSFEERLAMEEALGIETDDDEEDEDAE